MHFLLAANEQHKSFAIECVKSLDALGYKWTMFDLGGLGFGKPYSIQNREAQLSESHSTNLDKKRSHFSYGLHKPQLIADFLDANLSDGHPDLVVYLDADTVVRQRIDEITGNYDIGVTVRRKDEWKRLGRVNAGVLFFRPTEQARFFIRQWIQETGRVGDDQVALNAILRLKKPCAISEFPADIYNWYHFPHIPPAQAKILHFKSSWHDFRALREEVWKSACAC